MTEPRTTAERAEAPITTDNPFRDRYIDKATSSVGQTVKLAGFADGQRNHGGIAFLDLRDHSGKVQLVTENPALFADVSTESAITVTGVVQHRPAGTESSEQANGGVEIAVQSVTMHNRAGDLPFQVGDAKVGEQVKLPYRFFDLRNGTGRDGVRMRAEFLHLTREHFTSRGFTEVQTPILTGPSPEGARDYVVPSIKFPGQFYALPQAPQQFKELLMAAGFNRYFQIAPCFRDEAARADRSPGEHWQVDTEMSWATQADVFNEIELYMRGVAGAMSPFPITANSFEHVHYKTAVEMYGSDKPDLRIPETIKDVTTVPGVCDAIPFFTKAVADGKDIRAVRVAAETNPSRSMLDDLTKNAAKADGVAASWMIFDPEGIRGPLKMEADVAERLAKEIGLEPGDAVVVAVGDKNKTLGYLGRTRVATAPERFKNSGELHFTWIVDFPMFEADEHDPSKLAFAHNPFSMPRGGLEALNALDPLDIVADQYDLVCNGVELSSGAVRNHAHDSLLRAFEIAGYTNEQVETNFPAMYRATALGMPPHAGIAPGVERTLMVLLGWSNIRDVMAFPLTQGGADVLMGAPATLPAHVLAELGLAALPPKEAKETK